MTTTVEIIPGYLCDDCGMHYRACECPEGPRRDFRKGDRVRHDRDSLKDCVAGTVAAVFPDQTISVIFDSDVQFSVAGTGLPGGRPVACRPNDLIGVSRPNGQAPAVPNVVRYRDPSPPAPPPEPTGIGGTKKEERSNPPAPKIQDPPPVPDPAMFHGILGDIVTVAEPTTEADPAGIYVSLLAGAGVFIGPGPHLRIGNIRHPLLIWPLLFGRTGSGRKGDATDTAELFLRTACWENATLMVSGLSSGEGLIERIRDPILVEDGKDGGEVKTKGGTKDKRLFVVEPEFSTVMARAKRESNTLAAVLRQAWDGRALSVLNREALRASASHAAILAHITPKEFRTRLAESDMAGGTYNRFLPIYVERSKRLPIPEGVDEHTVDDLGRQLRYKIDDASKMGIVRLGDDAAKVWKAELYEEFTEADDDDGLWAEFARRAAPYCLRVAGLLTALDGAWIIEARQLRAAAALIRYSIASARFVLDGQIRDPKLDKIRRAIDAADVAGLTKTDISRLFSNNLAKDVLDELLSALEAMGYERFEKPTGGRPAVAYRKAPST